MESVGGSIKLMFFIYVLAALIALATAWIIKFIFIIIQFQKKRAAAPRTAQGRPAATPADAATKRTT